MRQLSIILFFVIGFQATLNGQDFCGHIKYRYTYYKRRNNKDITDKKLKEIKTEDFYICGNKFKVYIDGKFNDLFIGDSITYFLLSGGTIGYINAGNAYGEKPPKYFNFKKKEEFNGALYDTFEAEGVKYYFNDKIKINPSTFSELKLYHWNKFFQTTSGGIRLVSIRKTRQMIVVCEAVEINRMALTDIDFVPPTEYSIKPFDTFKVIN